MRKKTGITDKERALFRRQMQYAPILHGPEDKPSSKQAMSPACGHQFIVDEQGYFRKKGMQNKQLKTLCEGKVAICATVDLHGHTLYEAEAIMEDMLEKAQNKGWRLIRIVHGKGTGRLRQWLMDRLQEQPHIVAWQPAARQHGGNGAGYLLLKY